MNMYGLIRQAVEELESKKDPLDRPEQLNASSQLAIVYALVALVKAADKAGAHLDEMARLSQGFTRS